MRLPDEIRDAAIAFGDAFADALEISGLRTSPEGYAARAMPHAPFVSVRGLPPFDGVHRASYVECGVCVRLRLEHARVPAELGVALRAAYPELVGTDGDLYEYERAASSQYVNRARAMVRLADRVRACGFAQHGQG